MKKPNELTFVLLSLLLAASCGGGGGSSSGNSSTSDSTNVYVSSTGTQGFFAFEATLSDLHLVAEDGTMSVDLISNDVSVELVGLDDRGRLMGGAVVADGTYTYVRAVFDASSMSAMDESGDDVYILVGDDTWIMELYPPLVVAGGASDPILLELDLEASLSAAPAQSVPLSFDPEGDALTGPLTMDVDEFEGIVLEAFLGDGSLRVEAVASSGPALGIMEVGLDPETAFLDVEGSPFLSAEEFFDALSPEVTAVEVRGALKEGRFTARSLRIEDSSSLVEMEGRVLYVDDDFFVFLIREIEQGADIADPVLDSLGDPSTIDVFWNADTRFVLRDGTSSSADQLLVGQILEVQFQEFSFPPFVASEVEFEHGEDVQLKGTIVDVAGLPESFVLAVRPCDEDPIEVTIDVTEADIVLDVPHKPELGPSQLVTGLEARVTGRPGDTGTLVSLFDDDDDCDDDDCDDDDCDDDDCDDDDCDDDDCDDDDCDDDDCDDDDCDDDDCDDDDCDDDDCDDDDCETSTFLAASRVVVRAGKLKKAVVVATHTDDPSFRTVGGSLIGTFGDDVTPGPLRVLVPEGARFKGRGIATEEEFFSLFDELDEDEALFVDVRGIGAGFPDEVLGYDIKAKVRNQNGNDAPVALAGSDQSVAGGVLVTLDGSASFDPDGDPISFSWTQTDGPGVTLSGANTANPMFTSPTMKTMLTFLLTVSDGDLQSTDSVSVNVGANGAPTANAGPDQSVAGGASVALNGSASSDPDGDPLTFSWTQTAGLGVTLSDASSANPTFTAPGTSTTLTFELTVSDGMLQDTDLVDIVVQATSLVSYGNDVHPIWTNRGCVSCHPNAGGLDLSGPPSATYNEVIGLVDLMTPPNSDILLEPLAPSAGGVSHGGGTFFPNTSDPDYQTILTWITQGAPNN